MTESILPLEIEEQYDKALMSVEKKNYSYAIELLTHVLNIKPGFAKGRQLLLFAEIKNFEENTPNLVTRMTNRVFSFLYTFAAMINEAKGNYHNAIATYEKILIKDPKNAQALVKLGNLLKKEGMKEAACVTLEKTINISAKNPFAYELLGEIYSELGNYNRARFCFKKVLELKPHDANAERGLTNLEALTTIDKSFEKKDSESIKIRETGE
jgi:tetratricopeptide (TPR) repeat protein